MLGHSPMGFYLLAKKIVKTLKFCYFNNKAYFTSEPFNDGLDE